LILADEPVASLDPITTLSVMEDFTRINKMGITIIANMHHVDLAKKYSTRIIGIKAGQIVFDGKPSEIDDEVTKRIYGRSLTKNENLGNIEDLANKAEKKTEIAASAKSSGEDK
jgi:phosphonate transport system ATP-binding protein